jgi:hypothetical protein
MDGQNACRLSDKKFQNHENAADLMGAIGPPVVVMASDADDDCIVGTYDDIKDKCPKGHQAHHIVPDYSARVGTRIEGMAGQARIPGMPSFGNGPSVCLEGNARVTGSAHNVAHQCDAQIAALGHLTSNGPAGTAPKSEVVPIATEAAVKAAPAKCAKKIRDEVDKQYGGVDGNQSMRTTQQPSSGAAAAQLKRGGMVQRGFSAV